MCNTKFGQRRIFLSIIIPAAIILTLRRPPDGLDGTGWPSITGKGRSIASRTRPAA
jgi:hypothetical protein